MSSELYVGNLHPDISERELEDAFSKFGKIRRCHVKPSRNESYPSSSFGFVTFDASEDARDALESMDGSDMKNQAISVQYARGSRLSRGGYGERRYNGGGGGGGYGSSSSYGRNRDIQCYNCGRSGHIARFCPQSERDDRRGRSGDRGDRGDRYEKSSRYERSSYRRGRSRSHS